MKRYFAPFKEARSLRRKEKFIVLSLIPLYFILIGLFLQPINEIIPGIIRIVREPDVLITDYFAVGGIGAALINAGLTTLLSIGLLYFSGKEMDGHTITSACLMFGFSLFGKNIVNIWAIMAGVVLYAKYHGTSLNRYLYVGLYGTSLSPIMTQMMHIGKFPVPVCLMLSLLLGLVIGFVLPPLCTHVHYAHQGYSLYNVGFGAGIIATVVVSLAKSFGIHIESRLIWSVGNNTLFTIFLMVLFGFMIASAVAVRGKTILKSYGRILKTTGISGTDYLKDEGGATTVFNMGVNGLFATLFVLVVNGDLNGPTICGIFTIVGFSSTSEKYCSYYVWGLSCKFYKNMGDQSAFTDPGITVFYYTGTGGR